MKLTDVELRFTEEKLEKAFAELLGQEGFPHHLGITIARKPDEVLIEEDLRNFLLSQYAPQDITLMKSILLFFNLKHFLLLTFTKATKHSCKCFLMVLFSKEKTAAKKTFTFN